MKPEAMQAFKDEVNKKLSKNQVRIISWDDVKNDPPKQLKVSPMAQIPHKSRAYRTLLDLSHELKRGEQVAETARLIGGSQRRLGTTNCALF